MSTKKIIDNHYYGKEKISKILLQIAPPVMLAMLIQAMYNIVDSFFVGKYSDDALTALSVIYPLQLIIIALAVGTGVGVNTYMARKYAQNKPDDADRAAGTGMVLELVTWIVFAIIAVLIMRPYVMTSTKSAGVISDAVVYGNIISVGSIGAFLEGNWTKVHQAHGNMRLPMIAQVAGALTNIVLDPLMIFGIGPFPKMGVAGAATATVCGQILAAVITGWKGYYKPPKPSKMLHYINRIYFYGYSSIVMQALYTVYILALNIILAGFCDEAVTVLGMYYKLQSFFFIPLFGLNTCIVPAISYNYTRGAYERCRDIMKDSIMISAIFMVLGVIIFVFFPQQALSIFTHNQEVFAIGRVAFPIIGASFFPAIISLMMPVFYQAIGYGKTSLFLSVLRQVFCLIPIFWLFSKIGLNYSWIAFPMSELISGGIGLVLYFRVLKKWKVRFWG